jgi:hypothetical protein
MNWLSYELFLLSVDKVELKPKLPNHAIPNQNSRSTSTRNNNSNRKITWFLTQTPKEGKRKLTIPKITYLLGRQTAMAF